MKIKVDCIPLGKGDTSFKLGKLEGSGDYVLYFCRLNEPVGAGNKATKEAREAAKPYFGIRFSNPISIRMLIRALQKTYSVMKAWDES
jgi:hypothetical protein